jgi:hypothetical protein
MTTTPQSPDRNAAADVLAAMRRYNSNPQQTIALDLAIRALRAGGEAVAWMFQHDETGSITFVTADCISQFEAANNRRWRKVCPLYAAPPAAQPERAAVGTVDIDALAQALGNALFDNSVTRPRPRTHHELREWLREYFAALNPEAV